jgi:4a-hydroxytetrahydrobiopterin dehydratase
MPSRERPIDGDDLRRHRHWHDGYVDQLSGESETALTRAQASAAVTPLGWRYVLGVARTSVRVGSLAEAAGLAARLAQTCGPEANERLLLDVRPERLVITVRELVAGPLTAREIDLVHQISAAVGEAGLSTDADVGSAERRSVQVLEIAIDALDIASIRPFWKAVLGYVDEPGHSGPEDAIVDPVGQGPAIWFQQMAKPRPQRNRIHFDVSVPHDEAASRMQAVLGAGGRCVYEAEAPAFWALADAEGNEACITTWQGRD